ncbi:MAG TPA: hypothetical protein VGB55_05220 [Tepidisphaeraceae bacterium]|jgi:hypothetical protein
MYAQADPLGRLPPNFQTLVATIDIIPSTFVCRVSDDEVAESGTSWHAQMHPNSGHCSYEYRYRPGLTLNTLGADNILATEAADNHGKGGHNVLFGDFHVEYVNSFDPAATQAADNNAALVAAWSHESCSMG